MLENDTSVVVCVVTNRGHAEPFNVVVQPVMKGVDSPAAGKWCQVSMNVW